MDVQECWHFAVPLDSGATAPKSGLLEATPVAQDGCTIIHLSKTYRGVAYVSLGLIMFMGIYPGPVWTLARNAAVAL